jgi:hypothetical protein
LEDLDVDGKIVEDWRDLVGFGMVGQLSRLGDRVDEDLFRWVLRECRLGSGAARIQDRHQDRFAVEDGGRDCRVGSEGRAAAVLGEGRVEIVEMGVVGFVGAVVVAAAAVAVAVAVAEVGVDGAEETLFAQREKKQGLKALVPVEMWMMRTMNQHFGRV